ncbi:hypothetical protein [Microvirga pudoricolor]|uniref:hypothetical protein n=1 Tax=Microvirga pudoricolor TaxID=2778729 RepID=UPI00194E1315|nr:hypothetical protein [Microvirga pudoricolor]MBM6595692.1 hypothetical protein [Microvirga pudoricolor]
MRILALVAAFLLGGAVGFAVGLGGGLLLNDYLDVSCFEGACGYAAVAAGLAGAFLGAVLGPIMAVRALQARPRTRPK